MSRGLSSLISPFVDLKGVSERIKELSEDSPVIEDLVEEQMENALRELHPNDYDSFIEENRQQLEDMKRKIKKKYTAEIQDKISKFLVPATR